MGNQSSRRKLGGNKRRYKNRENGDKEAIEDLENITPESYNKFLAWMLEMAENDDADIGSPEFIEHITSACAAKQRQYMNQQGTGRQGSVDTTLTETRLNVPRQHSLDSSCGSRCSRSSKSREDLLDAKTRFKRSTLKRQTTVDYSDDSDAPIIDISSASSSFDHDQDYDIASPDTVLINHFSETSFSQSAFRPPLRKNQSCTSYRNNIGASLADLLNMQSKNKSKSLMTMLNEQDCKPGPINGDSISKLLDDNLLDSNIADILYSVEALWPKGAK